MDLSSAQSDDVGECHVLTVSGGCFLTTKEGTGPSSGSPHGFGSLAQFVEWSTGLADNLSSGAGFGRVPEPGSSYI